MYIRKTTEDDFDRVMEIYALAREFMKENGNPDQWGKNNWPPAELIHEDIEEGNSYVCVNDSDIVTGVFYYIYGKDIEPSYGNIEDGSWKGDDTYGVVHRIAADGSEKGTGSFCINWVYDQCGHVRIDTHSDNKVMQRMLEKAGFVHCGTIYVGTDNSPRLAFEKI